MEEFNAVLLKVMVSGILLFGIAAALLVLFMRGLQQEDRGERGGKSGHGRRAAALIIGLLSIALYFIWLAYRG